MHKLIKHKFCLFLVVAAFLFASCSFNSLEKPSTGSVMFRINGPKNRTAVDKTNGGLSFNVDAEIFLEVELKGGYEDSKTAKIENGSASLSFMEILVGTQLWAEASIFIIIEGNNKQFLYTGKSATVTIDAGENALSIPMTQVVIPSQETPESSDPASPSNPEEPTGTEEPSGTSDPAEPNGTSDPNGTTEPNGSSDPQDPGTIYVDIYVSAGGDASTADGSQTNPFTTFSDAFAQITDSESDYRIIVVGEYSSSETITFNSTQLVANSIILTGTKDSEDVDGCVKNTSNENSLFAVTTSIPITIKDISLYMTKSPAYGKDIKGIIVNVDQDSTVTLENGAILVNSIFANSAPSHCQGAVYSKGQVFIENGAMIKDFQANQGGGVHVAGGTVTMNGGKIQHCWSRYGGGVYVESGIFEMNGNAVIGGDNADEGCLSLNYGGGVYVKSTGTFIMNDNSRISYCGASTTSSSLPGAGIWSEGSATMNGGKICNNIAGYNTYKGKGGGVYIKGSSAVFNMNGGTIENNTNAESDSGVYVDSSATFNMKGNAVISGGNTVFLTSGRQIKLTGVLADGLNTRITFESYTPNATTLSLDGDSTGTSLPREAGKFTVTPQRITSTNLDGSTTTTTTIWKIRTDGLVNKLSVGDIVFNDGTAVAYHEDLSLSETQIGKAIAVIFNTTYYDSSLTSHILGIGLKQQSDLAWCSSSAKAANVKITSIVSGQPGSMGYSSTDYVVGSNSLSDLATYLSNNDPYINDTADVTLSDNYPAFNFAENYSQVTGNNVAGTDFANGWYLPTPKELSMVYDNSSTVISALGKCGVTFSDSTYYWTCAQHTVATQADLINITTAGFSSDEKTSTHNVCAIREF